MIRASLLFATVGLLAAAPLTAQNAGERSTQAGVFTEAQARRGEASYKRQCGACHTKSQFRGETFLGRWTGRTVHDFYDLLRTIMPFDNPGSLEPSEYIDIVAYILELNAQPKGEQELAADVKTLKMIRITAGEK